MVYIHERCLGTCRVASDCGESMWVECLGWRWLQHRPSSTVAFSLSSCRSQPNSVAKSLSIIIQYIQYIQYIYACDIYVHICGSYHLKINKDMHRYGKYFLLQYSFAAQCHTQCYTYEYYCRLNFWNEKYQAGRCSAAYQQRTNGWLCPRSSCRTQQTGKRNACQCFIIGSLVLYGVPTCYSVLSCVIMSEM